MQKIALFILGFLITGAMGWSSQTTHVQEIQCTLKPINRPKAPTTKTTTANQLFTSDIASLNWSGYVAAPNSNPKNSVSFVAGTWNIPTLSATPNTSYTAVWVGIDGFGSGTVEQLGTDHIWLNLGSGQGAQINYAWFEMYPGGSYEIGGFPVSPSDQISASVTYQGNGVFLLQMTNHTKNVSTTVPTSQTTNTGALRVSAEWVVEAPYSNGILPLSDFKSVTFQSCDAIINGVLGPINNSTWQNDQITMITPQGQAKAVPSGLTTFSSFNVTWDHE